MNGIINVYKPAGITSFDVVRKIKKISGEKKVGHTGTLDPLASGVLPVCIGKATKIVEHLMNKNKIYRAEIRLGIVTDTYDREGKILHEIVPNVEVDEIYSVVNSFIGEIRQVPPMYSALKVNGKKLYELARKGIEIEREPREITIYNIDILNIDMPYLEIEVKCSKGTYIRSLCYDIGNKLQCGATMWNLERIATGNFLKENSVNIDDINKNVLEQNLIKIEDVFMEYPILKLNSKFTRLALNGVNIKDNALLKDICENIMYRVYTHDNIFIGIGMRNVNGFKIKKKFS
ncbi:tRNA pseudouridine synthase B [Clostridium tepidiprofundi DSM 19306]|uniref:tRNA pseudouridine synthase B n=1 Tax=Clostridium tepidiprofundi DSM 19306 TaxID=1121338 RepID=A0A151B7B7_9CLOT|nr:tRNA pseudouridine(55) synthase TruB [Clostridium tepidiprofundi]KYH35789.1 tRNA pseudouridine synthase B [Clostridium tepidiprofundi DSM 19306]